MKRSGTSGRDVLPRFIGAMSDLNHNIWIYGPAQVASEAHLESRLAR